MSLTMRVYSKDEIDRKHSSEARRLRRIDAKQSETICFACRERGHAAKNCPNSKSSILDDEGLPRDDISVGVCYRCVNTHTRSSGVFYKFPLIDADQKSTLYLGAKSLRTQRTRCHTHPALYAHKKGTSLLLAQRTLDRAYIPTVAAANFADRLTI
jgi:hypothetical protein